MWHCASEHNNIFAYTMNTFLNLPSTFQSTLTQYEQSRNNIRDVIHAHNNIAFPRFGEVVTDIGDLVSCMCALDTPLATTYISCTSCNARVSSPNRLSNLLLHLSSSIYDSVRAHPTVTSIFHHIFFPTRMHPCSMCSSPSSATRLRELQFSPSFLALQITPEASDHIIIERHVVLQFPGGRSLELSLQSLIYLGAAHFTCRFIDHNDRLWYHDGISTGKSCILEGESSHSQWPTLNHARGRKISILIYRTTPQS